MFLAFFIGALGEELGWSGYVIDPMQIRWNALQASLILGLVGVVWQVVPLLLINRSPTWIAWWCLYAVAIRMLIVWLYNSTGKSVFAVALFHATLNLTLRLGGLVDLCLSLFASHWQDVQHVHVVQLAIADVDECGDRAAQVQQRVQLDRGLGRAKRRPVEKTEV